MGRLVNMGRGSSKISSGGNYIRFGKIPSNEKSINWFKASFNEQDDFNFELRMGSSYEEAAWQAFGSKDVWEEGVSVFKLGSDGLPEAENLQQLNSLVQRIDSGEKVFTLSGKQIGLGTDNEPLVKNVTNSNQVTLNKDALVGKVEKTLEKNYKTVEKNNKNAAFTKGEFSSLIVNRDDNHNVEEVMYNGKTYKNPVKGWNEKQGYNAYRRG